MSPATSIPAATTVITLSSILPQAIQANQPPTRKKTLSKQNTYLMCTPVMTRIFWVGTMCVFLYLHNLHVKTPVLTFSLHQAMHAIHFTALAHIPDILCISGVSILFKWLF
jgi:hypothetical protein